MISAAQLRTGLTLARVQHLPTAWSNALAGWWLGGGGSVGKLLLILIGVTLVASAGAYLNDAFDEAADRHRRADRPIVNGAIAAGLVWRLGFGQLIGGVILLAFCGKTAAIGAMLLALTLLLYNLTHQFFNAAPWLLGACRFWVYVTASAAGAEGLNGLTIFCGVALLTYTAGVGMFTRREILPNRIPWWRLLALMIPIAMALLLNTGDFRRDALCISTVLFLWLVRCLRPVLFGGEINPPWLAANLTAGIVLVDWLAVAPQQPHLQSTILFLSLFGLTKWFQKLVLPARVVT